MLAAGLHAKLAVRNEGKAKDVVAALEKIHGKGRISTVTVTDFAKEGAYDEAVQGVQAIIHTASDVSFSDIPDEVIVPVLKAYRTILEAAHAQKQIRRFVFTSSSVAVGPMNRGSGPIQRLDVNSWNDEAVEQSKTAPNGHNAYAASKVLSERAVWDFVKTNKPSFVATSINPSGNFGKPVPGLPFASTGLVVPDVATGVTSWVAGMGAIYHVDVDDVAKLHALALTREDVKNERILAYGTPYNYNTVIDLVHKLKPSAPVEAKREEWGGEDRTKADVSRANELLKDQGGLRDLEYSVRVAVEAL